MSRDDSILRPKSFLRYLQKEVGLATSQMRLPRWGVIVFGSQDWHAFRRRIQGKALSWNRTIAVGHAKRTPLAVARSPIGAPAAAIAMEEMAALGVRNFVGFGACGSLVPDIHIGDIILARFAVSDEGTSRLYGGGERAHPDGRIQGSLTSACDRRSLSYTEGGVWTVDAPYRESRARARRLARLGVEGVDMEASAIWTVARARGLRVASVFVVSDELGGYGWNPGFRDPRFLVGKANAIPAVIDAICEANQ